MRETEGWDKPKKMWLEIIREYVRACKVDEFMVREREVKDTNS